MNTFIIIPARIASTRFPGKLLKEVKGKSILQHTFEQANELKDKNTHIYVAAADHEIQSHCILNDIPVIKTVEELPNGTFRVYEAIKDMATDNDMVYNWQADYPMLNPALLEKMQYTRKHNDHTIYSAFYRGTGEELNVQVVTDRKGDAMFFSRKAIPYGGEKATGNYKIHVGIYNFTFNRLKAIHKLTNEFRKENLEQLSWLYQKYKMHMFETEKTISIDTEKDYLKFKEILNA